MSSNNDYNVIDISGKGSSESERKKYSCNYCRRHLYLRDKETQEYICTFCNIIYYPNNQLVKKENRFEVPDGSDPNQNRVPPIVMMDEPGELSSTTYKQQKLTAAYEALRKQGFKFTSYEER